FPVINRLDGVVADFGRFGLDSSGAQNLAGVLGFFGCLLVSCLCRIRLCRDIELQQCGVGRSFVFSIGAGEYTVRLSSYGRTILSKDSSNQPQCNKKRSRNLHARHPFSSGQTLYALTASIERTCPLRDLALAG